MSQELTDLLTQAVHSFLSEMNTCAPGTIVSYDGQRAVCKYTLSKLAADGRLCEGPEIVSVPVVFPGGTGWQISGPLAKGDGVLLVFSQRALEAWHDKGNGTPDDPRMFSLSDAIAIPGLNCISFITANLPKADTTNVCIQYKDASIKLTPDGKILTAGEWEHTGTFKASDVITAPDAKLGDITFSKHLHKVTNAPGETGVPEG